MRGSCRDDEHHKHIGARKWAPRRWRDTKRGAEAAAAATTPASCANDARSGHTTTPTPTTKETPTYDKHKARCMPPSPAHDTPSGPSWALASWSWATTRRAQRARTRGQPTNHNRQFFDRGSTHLRRGRPVQRLREQPSLLTTIDCVVLSKVLPTTEKARSPHASWHESWHHVGGEGADAPNGCELGFRCSPSSPMPLRQLSSTGRLPCTCHADQERRPLN